MIQHYKREKADYSPLSRNVQPKEVAEGSDYTTNIQRISNQPEIPDYLKIVEERGNFV